MHKTKQESTLLLYNLQSDLYISAGGERHLDWVGFYASESVYKVPIFNGPSLRILQDSPVCCRPVLVLDGKYWLSIGGGPKSMFCCTKIRKVVNSCGRAASLRIHIFCLCFTIFLKWLHFERISLLNERFSGFVFSLNYAKGEVNFHWICLYL